MKILVINAGSSSVKYQLYDTEQHKPLAKGSCTRIGIDGEVKHTANGETIKESVPLKTHEDAIKVIIGLLTSKDHGVISSMKEVDAVGHRVVHGGETFKESVLVTENVIKSIEDVIPLAPLHNPAAISGIRACQHVMGDIPQVVVFDTAFHQTMHPAAYLYAIPYEYYEKYKIRRYGFHGTSHRYIAQRAAELLGRPKEELKIISCHLGNGSSVCAIRNGKSFDTSMGFTPLAGLPMGTRSGDVDPSVIQFIMNHEHMDVDEVLNMLNKQSGMQGVSELTSDFVDLVSIEGKHDQVDSEKARRALSIFNYSVRKLIGAYAAAMKGVDALVFTGGIGENNYRLRKYMAAGLDFMGLEMDNEKNEGFREEGFINKPGSRAKIMVIPTEEEMMIATDTERIVSGLKK